VLLALAPLLANQRSAVDEAANGPPFRGAPDLVDCRKPFASAAIGIHRSEVGKRYEGGNWLACTLDDQALTVGRLVEQLTETLPDFEGGDRSHSAIIAL
jgi:hypothetical protein